MENLKNNKLGVIDNLTFQEKLLYSVLALVMIFGFFTFFLPLFLSKEPISFKGSCDGGFQKDTNNVAGWAFDGNSGETVENLRLHITSFDRSIYYVIKNTNGRISRPDVVKALNAPKAEMSGFGISVPADVLRENTQYELILEQTNSNGVKIFCKLNDFNTQ